MNLETSNRLYERQRAAGDLMGYALAKSLAGADRTGPQGVVTEFQRLRPHSTKAAVPAMGLGSTGLDPQGGAAFSELIMSQALTGKIPGAQPAPPYARLSGVTTGATASPVVAGQPIPLSKLDLSATAHLTPGTIGVIAAYSRELARHADPAAFNVIQSDLVRAMAEAQDLLLLDGGAAVVDGRPASILEGLSSLGGGSPSSTESDIAAVVAAVGPARNPTFICSLAGAMFLGLAREGDQRMFPDVRIIDGGSIFGVKMLISPAALDKLIYLDGSRLYYYDGGAELDSSQEASFQFDSAPTAGAANTVALFQSNSVALRATQRVAWQLLPSSAAAFTTLPI